MPMVRVLCAYLLWLPPMGWLGLHQCYLGRHYHAVWIFTTFAGFFVGWFRDLWKIPRYAAAPPEFSDYDTGCCCGVYTRLKQCLSRIMGGQLKGNTHSKDVPEKEDDLSDAEDRDPTSETVQKPEVATETVKGALIVKKVIEELVELQLRKEFEKDGGQPPEHPEINQIIQVRLKSKIDELTQDSISTDGFKKLLQNEQIDELMQDSISTDGFKKLLQNEQIDEEEIKRRLEISVKHSFKEELVKIVERTKARKDTSPPSTARDLVLSDDEDNDVEVSDEKKERRRQIINKSSLSVMDNIERVLGAFITAKYYRGLVTAAVSDYLETGWIIYYPLKLLPLVGMMCGVYLVSNIGKPPRLTLSSLLLSGLVGEALFGVVAEILYGGSVHFLACLVCTLVAVYYWQWPTSESAGRSNKYSGIAVTLCACVVMTLVWGSIIMNTTIEVDNNNITISEALHNFYNSPAWSQMKLALWDMIIMYLEGNWDEANETLLRMSDLSGAERALSVLDLPRDADEATIKVQYKKLAREWHPDKYQGEDKEAASNKFIEIQQAYTLLTKRIRA